LFKQQTWKFFLQSNIVKVNTKRLEQLNFNLRRTTRESWDW